MLTPLDYKSDSYQVGPIIYVDMLILMNVFHIFQRFELPRQLSIKEIRTQEAVVVKYTFGKPRTSAD